MQKRIGIFFFSLILASAAFSQFPRLSIATDFGIQRSFREEQEYWAVGHTVHALVHLTPKDGAYFWVSYYSDGKFHNNVIATAKSPLTIPQQINYRNDASMRFKQFSVGWKRYIKGRYDSEEDWNIYGSAGFGIMLGRVINEHSPYIDTTNYSVPVRVGKANFKRLTLDLALGWETPIGADIFLYGEGRAWVPTTDYPSKYIFVNNNAPFTGMLNVGIRVLFD